MMRNWVAVLTVALCSACLADLPSDPPPDPGECGASALQTLVGRDASALDGMRFSQTVRVIRPGMAITEDFSPARLNFDIDAQGRISRVWCG